LQQKHDVAKAEMKAVLHELDFYLVIETEGVNHFKLKPFDNNRE
jgi:hypothetical protein